MRICFVADPSHPNTERWVGHFAEVLGHDVWVLATKPGTEAQSSPYHVVPLPVRRKWQYLTLSKRVRAQLREIAPDLLIGYRIQSHGLAVAATGFRPLVLAAQTQNIVSPPDSRFLRWCARYALRRADLVHAWGGHMAERIRELGAPGDRILVMPRGVDTGRFKAPAEPTAAPVAIVTRGLRKVYRHDRLLRAWKCVRDRVPDARLVVAGDGEERERLTRLTQDLGLEQAVEFCGYLTVAELSRRVGAARCYVTAVATEGISSSLLEAMSCGVVPVVVDLPGNREWVRSGENGLLLAAAQFDQPGELADVLVRALTDGELQARSFASNPAQVAATADWETNMRRMEAVYRNLAGCE